VAIHLQLAVAKALCVCVLQGPPGTGTGPGATDSVSSLKGLDLDEASLSELDDEVS